MNKMLYNPTFSEINTIYKGRRYVIPARKSKTFGEDDDLAAEFLLQVYPFLLDKTPQPIVEPPKTKDISKAFGKKVKRRIV